MTPLTFTADEREYRCVVRPHDAQVEVGRVWVFGIWHRFIVADNLVVANREAASWLMAVHHVLKHGTVSIWLDGTDKNLDGVPWVRTHALEIPMYGMGRLAAKHAAPQDVADKLDRPYDLTLPAGAELAASVTILWTFADLPGDPWALAQPVRWLPRVRVVVPNAMGSPARRVDLPVSQ